MIKLLPYYLYQIDAIESWLDDQAKKGLFLTDVRSRLTMGFEKGEPRPVRYRIDVTAPMVRKSASLITKNWAGNTSASWPVIWTSTAAMIPLCRS